MESEKTPEELAALWDAAEARAAAQGIDIYARDDREMQEIRKKNRPKIARILRQKQERKEQEQDGDATK